MSMNNGKEEFECEFIVNSALFDTLLLPGMKCIFKVTDTGKQRSLFRPTDSQSKF